MLTLLLNINTCKIHRRSFTLHPHRRITLWPLKFITMNELVIRDVESEGNHVLCSTLLALKSVKGAINKLIRTG